MPITKTKIVYFSFQILNMVNIRNVDIPRATSPSSCSLAHSAQRRAAPHRKYSLNKQEIDNWCQNIYTKSEKKEEIETENSNLILLKINLCKDQNYANVNTEHIQIQIQCDFDDGKPILLFTYFRVIISAVLKLEDARLLPRIYL